MYTYRGESEEPAETLIAFTEEIVTELRFEFLLGGENKFLLLRDLAVFPVESSPAIIAAVHFWEETERDPEMMIWDELKRSGDCVSVREVFTDYEDFPAFSFTLFLFVF